MNTSDKTKSEMTRLCLDSLVNRELCISEWNKLNMQGVLITLYVISSVFNCRYNGKTIVGQ